MDQRYYDPAVGRFLSVDPMASDTQNGWNFNRYNYAANNPYKFTDPDGRSITCSGNTCTIDCNSLFTCGADYLTYGLLVAQRHVQNAVADAQNNESAEQDDTGEDRGRRRKNRLPDRGEPNTEQENEPGTTKKRYGSDGWVEKEWNRGHGESAPEEERDDHVHDHVPNPYHPDGKPTRQPGRKPTPEEERELPRSRERENP